MTSSDIPPDKDIENTVDPSSESDSQNTPSIQSRDEATNSSYQSSVDGGVTVSDIQLNEIPGLDNNDFRADTLEFESISRRPRRRTIGIRVILFLLIIGGGVYFTWAQWNDVIFSSIVNSLPIVRAPEEPFKVRPVKPGGKNFPNRDKLVYDRLESKPPQKKAENLLPRPEVPLLPSRSKILEKDELMFKPESQFQAPKTIGSQPTTEEVKAIKKPALNSASSVLRKKSSKNMLNLIPKIQSTSLPNPAPPAIRDPAIKNQRVGGYQIQLAAVRTAASAEKEWSRLRTKNKNLLRKLKLNVVRADLGNQGIFFRLRAGPIANRASATALCQALARAKVGCLVVAPPR